MGCYFPRSKIRKIFEVRLALCFCFSRQWHVHLIRSILYPFDSCPSDPAQYGGVSTLSLIVEYKFQLSVGWEDVVSNSQIRGQVLMYSASLNSVLSPEKEDKTCPHILTLHWVCQQEQTSRPEGCGHSFLTLEIRCDSFSWHPVDIMYQLSRIWDSNCTIRHSNTIVTLLHNWTALVECFLYCRSNGHKRR